MYHVSYVYMLQGSVLLSLISYLLSACCDVFWAFPCTASLVVCFFLSLFPIQRCMILSVPEPCFNLSYLICDAESCGFPSSPLEPLSVSTLYVGVLRVRHLGLFSLSRLFFYFWLFRPRFLFPLPCESDSLSTLYRASFPPLPLDILTPHTSCLPRCLFF